MLHKAWNSKEKMPYCFPRSSIKFQGHTGQNITDFDPNWAFPDYRPVAAFKSLRFALFQFSEWIHFPDERMFLRSSWRSLWFLLSRDSSFPPLSLPRQMNAFLTHIELHIVDIKIRHSDDVTWTSCCLKSPVIRLFADPHQRNIKLRITGPLWREFTGHRWIPRTKGQ